MLSMIKKMMEVQIASPSPLAIQSDMYLFHPRFSLVLSFPSWFSFGVYIAQTHTICIGRSTLLSSSHTDKKYMNTKTENSQNIKISLFFLSLCLEELIMEILHFECTMRQCTLWFQFDLLWIQFHPEWPFGIQVGTDTKSQSMKTKWVIPHSLVLFPFHFIYYVFSALWYIPFHFNSYLGISLSLDTNMLRLQTVHYWTHYIWYGLPSDPLQQHLNPIQIMLLLSNVGIQWEALGLQVLESGVWQVDLQLESKYSVVGIINQLQRDASWSWGLGLLPQMIVIIDPSTLRQIKTAEEILGKILRYAYEAWWGSLRWLGDLVFQDVHYGSDQSKRLADESPCTQTFTFHIQHCLHIHTFSSVSFRLLALTLQLLICYTHLLQNPHALSSLPCAHPT